MLPIVACLAALTSACGVPVAVSAASYAADGGLIVASDKTSTDHVASVVTKRDCAMWRIFRGRAVCKDREGGEDPYNTDYSDPQRQVSEDGTQYAPPLRPAAGAPAASWDAASYKAEPGPAPRPEGPMTASIDPESAPATSVAPADAPKATAAPAKGRKAKPSGRSSKAKKPARGQAASAP